MLFLPPQAEVNLVVPRQNRRKRSIFNVALRDRPMFYKSTNQYLYNKEQFLWICLSVCPDTRHASIS